MKKGLSTSAFPCPLSPCLIIDLTSPREHGEGDVCAVVLRNWLCVDVQPEQPFYIHMESLSILSPLCWWCPSSGGGEPWTLVIPFSSCSLFFPFLNSSLNCFPQLAAYKIAKRKILLGNLWTHLFVQDFSCLEGLFPFIKVENSSCGKTRILHM